jgi:FlaA1/EpsC-like NDP-sugar epimerase
VRLPLRNRYFFALDLLLLPVAAYLSYVLRLEDFDARHYGIGLLLLTVLAVGATIGVFLRFGIYARYWRFASVDDLLQLALAVVVGATIGGGAAVIVHNILLRPETIVPLSVPVIYLLLALLVTAVPRLGLRFYNSYRRRPRRSAPRGTPVLIAGAGSSGSMILRELQQNLQLGYEVIGFVDDDPAKQNVRILGTPVLGTPAHIPQLTAQHKVRLVIIAMPTASGKVIRRIVQTCELVSVKTKIIPGMYELLDGKVSFSQLRSVQIDDLLRRQPVAIDTAEVGQFVRGRRVLVTGGGGSIGSELCRQVLRFEPAELVILGHGENSIFMITNELQRMVPAGTRLEPVIADIRFANRVNQVFEQYRPEVVFHAAAHKHVPLMEVRPIEAVSNNIFGTRNLLHAALAVGTDSFVMISTDKAVNPTSIMGTTKRVAELLVLHTARMSGRHFQAVRFGNVLGSRGSVVLTFRQQIATGGPVTVTHPEMRRYFMTIPEAVQLVMQAATIGKGGEVFTLDMGEPVKIVDLARDMIELSGLEVGRDIDIVFTGMRPGEKLYEELFVAGEEYARTHHEKIFIAKNASSIVPVDLDALVDDLTVAANSDQPADVVAALHELVPQLHHTELPRTSRETAKLLSRTVGAD